MLPFVHGRVDLVHQGLVLLAGHQGVGRVLKGLHDALIFRGAD